MKCLNDRYEISLASRADSAQLLVRDLSTGVIVGMGACIIRKAYINGEIRTAGYLTGLKGLPSYRKKVPAISDTYRYLHEQTRGESG